DQLQTRPELILVDGNRFHPYNFIPHQCIIKGDASILSIACASILAKNYRDQLMIKLHDEFPHYGWKTNMGYATKEHREALNRYGPTGHHRRSFRLDYSDQASEDRILAEDCRVHPCPNLVRARDRFRLGIKKTRTRVRFFYI